MKIIHVTPTYFADSSVIGGGERYVNNVCKALNLQGSISRSDILSFGPKACEISFLPKSLLRIAPAQPAKSFGEVNAYVNSGLRDYLAEYDVVHIHQCLTPFGLFVASHARLLGKKVIGTDHGGGETPLFLSHPFLFDVFDILHSQSDFAAAAFADASFRSRVIKGPMDDEKFMLAHAEDRDPRLFIAIGRILPHKGFENLIDTLPEQCRLIIVGRVGDTEYFQLLRSRVGNKQIEFASSLDDAALLALIRQAGLCLHASVRVGFRGDLYLKAELLGLAPLECMSTGMPAICSQTAALRELGQLQGCRTYQTKDELADLLYRYVTGSLNFPQEDVIREDARKYYGLEQFGRHYLAAINDGSPCAS
ncbi:MAG: glycosyltransferase family 4 protein [Methylovirgula sp.]